MKTGRDLPKHWLFKRLAPRLGVLLASGLCFGLPPRTAKSDPNDDAAKAAAQADIESALHPSAKSRRNRYQRSKLTYDESEGTADRRRLLLTTGEDKTVDLDFDANTTSNGITIGNPLIAATTLVKVGDRRQLVFKPLKPGETTVSVRDVDGTLRLIFSVRVTGSNLLRIAGEVRDLLRDVEGIDIRIVGPKVILEGEVLVPQDYGRIYTVVTDAAYKDFVLNITTLSPLGMQVLAKKMQDDIHNFAPNVTTRVVNGTIFLEGTVDVAYKATRAAEIASIYLPEVKPATLLDRDATAQHAPPRRLVQNFIIVDPPPPKKQEKIVRVTAHFVELSKDYNKLFGFKWAPGFTPGSDQLQIGQGTNGGAAATGATFSATISNLFPKLQSAQTAGFARILKTGTVIVRSSQPAVLTEDTQVPYTAIGQNGVANPTQADVVFSLAVTPLILGQSEDIQLDLKMTQTDALTQLVAGSPPITSKHEVQTKIYVKSNESAAVAAVNTSDIGTDFNKDDPNAGSFSAPAAANGTTGAGANTTAAPTSALFSLLHSKNYHKQKSQFVIFITPQIIENASDGTQDLKKNFRVRVN